MDGIFWISGRTSCRIEEGRTLWEACDLGDLGAYVGGHRTNNVGFREALATGLHRLEPTGLAYWNLGRQIVELEKHSWDWGHIVWVVKSEGWGGPGNEFWGRIPCTIEITEDPIM